MRTARKKMSGRACYYHCCARMAGFREDYLFTDADRERGMRIVKDLSRLFLLEPISMSWMGNHWHLVLYAPGEKPSLRETAARYNAYYGRNHRKLDADFNPEECERTAARLVDISFFIRQIHQKFTCYMNRIHERRGTLWADRFKSTILEDRSALWNCVQYVELNAVRAGLVSSPANYRFCTWGNYCGTGRHMFGNNFTRHMRSYLGESAADWSDEDVMAEFRSGLAGIIARETGASTGEIAETREKARRRESIRLRFLRRTRHWTDGAIIGSHSFVREVAVLFDITDRVMKKHIPSGTGSDGIVIHCFKRLRSDGN